MSLLKNDENVKAGHAAMSIAVLRDGRYLAPPQDKDGKIWVRTSAIIQADANKLYAMWRDVEAAPQWQEQMKEVIRTGDTTSHWVMMRGGRTSTRTVEWDAEILADEPGKRIAWHSTGGDLETAGEVVFDVAPNGRGTMVTVLQEFKIGTLAVAWETLTGRNPKQGVIENLRHFKALAETGEIPRIQGQPHGPRGTSGDIKASTYGETIPVPPGN